MFTRATALSALLALVMSLSLHAQTPPGGGAQTGPPTVQHPPVLVTAQKEPADPQGLPVGVTTVPVLLPVTMKRAPEVQMPALALGAAQLQPPLKLEQLANSAVLQLA